MNRDGLVCRRAPGGLLPPALAQVFILAMMLQVSNGYAQRSVKTGGEKEITLPAGLSVPQDVAQFVKDQSIQVLGYVRTGDLVLEGIRQGRRGRYVLVSGPTVTLRELADEPYLRVSGDKVDNIGLVTRVRNSLGVILVDIRRFLAYYVPSVIVFGDAQRALDARDQAFVLLRTNLQQNRFRTTFELTGTTLSERAAAARGAFLTPLGCFLIGGLLYWIRRHARSRSVPERSTT